MIGKYLVVGAFVAGLLAFFLPFFSMQGPSPDGGTAQYSFSAMQMMRGADAIKDAVAAESSNPELVAAVDTGAVSQAVDGIKAMLLVPFVPTVLFLLVSLIGIKRFGRGLGATSLIVGLIALAGWALLNAGMSEAGSRGTDASFGVGFTLLLVGALLGIVGGLAALVKPQPRAIEAY